MKINIYVCGDGTQTECALVEIVKSTLRSANLEGGISVVRDLQLIGERGLCGLPAVEVDGKIIAQGRLPRATEIARAFPSWTCGVRPEDIR